MAVKIKFPLKMGDGAQVRTIEELREHFDLAAILGYYDNGKLGEWLADRYYEEESRMVRALEFSATDFKQRLCDILGVPNAEDVNFTNISDRNKRLEHLKKYTADDTILAAVECVAFTQEEVERLLDNEDREIYLCGERFNIPGNTGHVTFIGVNYPTVHILEEVSGNKIIFKGVRFENDELINIAKAAIDPIEAVVWWTRAAEADNAEAQFQLAECYKNGIGVDENPETAVKWYQSSAEQGFPNAQSALGDCYRNGYGVEKNSDCAVDWYRRAAEQGDSNGQNNLGFMYWTGDGVEQSYEESNRCFLQAAEQGCQHAQYYLGLSYRDGNGVVQNIEEAIKWFKKSANQGYKSASSALMELDPKSFKLSDVILYAIGGVGNLKAGSKLSAATGVIDILVHDRHEVNETIFRSFGATSVWIETEYYTYSKTKDASAKQAFRAFGCFLKNSIKTALTDAPPNLPDFDNNEKETICEDLGEGCVHITLSKISSDMEDDFNNSVKPQGSAQGVNVSFRKMEVTLEENKKMMERFMR